MAANDTGWMDLNSAPTNPAQAPAQAAPQSQAQPAQAQQPSANDTGWQDMAPSTGASSTQQEVIQKSQEPEYGSDEWYSRKVATSIPSTSARIGTGPYSIPLDPLTLANKVVVEPFEQLQRWGGLAGKKAAESVVTSASSALHPVETMKAALQHPEAPGEAAQQVAHKELPHTMGIAEGVGGMAGEFAADPRNWPLMSGALAKGILGKVITGGFGTMMAKGTWETAKDLAENWDNYTPEERSEKATRAGLSGIMTTLAALHLNGEIKGSVKTGVKEALRKQLTPVIEETPRGAMIPTRPEGKLATAVQAGAPELTEKLAQTQTAPAVAKAVGGTVGEAIGSETATKLTPEDRMGLKGHANDLIENQARPAYQEMDKLSKAEADAHPVPSWSEYLKQNAGLSREELSANYKALKDANMTFSDIQEKMDNARKDFTQEGRKTFKEAQQQKADMIAKYRYDLLDQGIDIDVADAAYRRGKAAQKMAKKLDTATGPSDIEGAEYTLDGKKLQKIIDTGVKDGSWSTMGLSEEHIDELQSLAKIMAKEADIPKVSFMAKNLGKLAVAAAGLHGGMFTALEAVTGMSLADHVGTKIANHVMQDAMLNYDATRAMKDALRTGDSQPVVAALSKDSSWIDRTKAYVRDTITRLIKGERGEAGLPGTVFEPSEVEALKKLGMSDEDIDKLQGGPGGIGTEASTPEVGEGVGGHAGGGVVSAEELARGRNWMVDKNGNVTYDGAVHRPEETPVGGAHVTEKADGTLQVNEGELTPKMQKGLDNAIAERESGKARLSQAAVKRAKVQVTKTPEFKKWFGKSKVLDEKGQPKVLYHGTTHEFTTFEPERGNIEGHYGKGIYFSDSPVDVSANYAGEGPDLTSRIERRAEQIANEENLEQPKYGTPEYKKFYEDLKNRAKSEIAGQHGGAAMPTYVKMENPLEISQRGRGTKFEITIDEDGNESGNGLKLYQAVQDVVGEYGIDPNEIWGKTMEVVGDPEFSAHRFDKALDKALEDHDIYTDEGQSSGELKRKVYQAAGFDGIIETASDAFPRMKDIPAGTKHYVAFEPEQVKSAIGNTGEFSPTNPDIRFRNAPEALAKQAHPITQEHIQDAFPGQWVEKVDDHNFSVDLDNGNTIHVMLRDVVNGGGIEIKPGNAVFGRWDALDDGGVMQLAGIAGDQTLRHETFHAAMDILPERIKDALIEKYGDEEKAADAYGEYRPETKTDSLLGQVRDFFTQLYDKIFRPAQAAFREIHEGKVWDRANEKFIDSTPLRPDFSVKTYPKWEKDFRKVTTEQGASPQEIEKHIKLVAPAYNMFRELTNMPPDLPGSNVVDNAWEGKKTTFEYQGFCPKNKNYNPTKAGIEKSVGRFLNKQETIGLTLLMHSEALDAPCNYCYTLSRSAAVSENVGRVAREGVWVAADSPQSAVPKTGLKLKSRQSPDKPETRQVFIPPVEERLLVDKEYRDKQIANNPKLAQEVALQQWYGRSKTYSNMKAHKPLDEGIIPARGAMLRMSDEHIADVNSRRGFRISGNVDVTPYSYLDVAQDMADFRLRGAKRYSYTKQPTYVRLVGNTGEKINMSLTMDPRGTNFIANDWSDSMNINEARALRKEFPNAGGMLMALNDNHILTGLQSGDVDMMIPYHGTRTKFPAAIRDFVQDYSRENHETDIKTGQTVSGTKEIKQTEHNGDLATYLRLCKERGYLPKFARFIYDNVEFNKSANGVSSVHLKVDPETGVPEEPKIRKDTSKNFMKLVKDIARTDTPHEPIKQNVDMKILEQVVSQIKTGTMPWQGEANPAIVQKAVERLKAGKPLYNGEMGFSYSPASEVPPSKLVTQIAPAPKTTTGPAPKATHTYSPKAGLKKVR